MMTPDLELKSALASLFELSLRPTLVLAIAALLVFALRSASAAARHLVAVAGLVAALAIPFLQQILPRLEVPILAAAAAEPAAWTPQPDAARPSAELRAQAVPDTIATEAAPLERRSGAAARLRVGLVRALEIWVVAAWALVALFLLARLVMGVVRVRRWVKDASPAGSEWEPALRRAADALGVRQPIKLLQSDDAPVALTAGALDPVVLLPPGAADWTEACRRSVLLHELAHVRRRDWLALLAAETAYALYWFHPLAWLSLRSARRDAEEAADDLALRSGARASDYAAHLLSLARSLRAGSAPLAPAMAWKGAGFERRLRAVLSPSRRSSLLPGAVAATGLLAFALVLAAARPTVAAVLDEPSRVIVRPDSLRVKVDALRIDPMVDLKLKTAMKLKLDPQVAAKLAELKHASAALALAQETLVDWHARNKLDVLAAQEAALTAQAAATEELSGHHGGDEGDDDEADDDRGQDHRGDHSLLHRLRNQLSDVQGDWYDRAMEQHQEEKYQQAIELWQQAISHGEREGAASYNIGCAYARLGDTGHAVEWLRKAQARGFDLEQYVLRDDDLESLRQEQPFKDLLKELRANPDSELQDRISRASRKLDKLVADHAAGPGSINDAGKQLLNSGEYAKAAQAYHEAAARSGSPATSLYNAACAEALGGDKEAAFRSLRAAIDAGWDDAEHIQRDSDLDSLHGDPRFSELKRSARELAAPSSNQGFWSLFSRKGQERRSKEAAQHFEELTSREPKNGAAWYKLGYSRLAADDAKGAAQAFARALELGFRKGATLYNLACAEARQDHKDRAFDYLDQAIAAGFEASGQLRSDDDLDNLRGDPRMRDLLRRAKRAEHAERDDDEGN